MASGVRSLDDIEASVVLLVPRGERSVLLATYTTRPGAAIPTAAVRQGCEALLPRTHVPAMVRALDRYPLTPTGKIDRARVSDALRDEALAGPAGRVPGVEGSARMAWPARRVPGWALTVGRRCIVFAMLARGCGSIL